MARDLFGLEKGVRVFDVNGDPVFEILNGTGVPGGDAGEQDAAPVPSLYSRTGTDEIYTKKTNLGSTADWELIGGVASPDQFFREECVRAVTGEVLAAGVRNLTTTPFTDDEGTTLAAADFTIGEFVIGGQGSGSPLLLEVTDVTAPNITLSVPATAPVLTEGNNFVAKNYLPDTPDDQEAQALIHYNGVDIIKLGDVNWELLTGVSLSGSYVAAAGDVAPGDSGEEAIAKLDGNNDAQDSVLGTAQGDTDLGTFAGDIISDNTDVKTGMGELEAELDKVKEVIFQGTIAQNTPTVIDTVLVDEFQWCEWRVVARDQGTRSAVKSLTIVALHQGHDTSDVPVGGVDTSVSDKERKGANFNLKVDVVLSGSGAAQTMGLQLDTTDADGIFYTVERTKCLPLAG